jgi:hypothetical protein
MADDSERDNALFVNLVLIFQSAAMQQMGKILNPLTGKVDRNLEQARFSIDTLSMLKEKTRGNLSPDLERLLDSTLLQLRMNFVEESRVEEQPTSGREQASADETGAQAQRTSGREQAAGEEPGAGSGEVKDSAAEPMAAGPIAGEPAAGKSVAGEPVRADKETGDAGGSHESGGRSSGGARRRDRAGGAK